MVAGTFAQVNSKRRIDPTKLWPLPGDKPKIETLKPNLSAAEYRALCDKLGLGLAKASRTNNA